MTTPNITKDSDWIRQAFMLQESDIHETHKVFREFSTASLKFADTRLGGNVAINPPAQYTPFADIAQSGRLFDNKAGNRHNTTGMGRYYSEQIDDHSLNITMQFGVPEYNGMISFFTGFYNAGAGNLARTGRGLTVGYALGRVAGAVASLYVWKFIAVGYFFRVAAGFPPSKYYYMKETMHTYWVRVNTIMNSLGANMGLVPLVWKFDDPSGKGVDPIKEAGDTGEWTDEDRKQFHRLMPDVFREDGGIDVFAVASKYQRAANQNQRALQEQLEAVSNEDDLKKRMNTFVKSGIDPNKDGKPDLDKYLERYHNSPAGNLPSSDLSAVETSNLAQWKEKENQPGVWEILKSKFTESYGEYALADLREGFKWVSFRVENDGPVQESFSNSVAPSNIQQKINGMSSSARSARFDFSNGATGVAPLDWLTQQASEAVAGALDSFHMSGLLSLAGNAFVDIPKTWESSSANFPRASYTIKLRSPYGHMVSRMQNLYFPLAMLLAAALPISTGKQSYTAPFLCKLFYRGRVQCQLGMITDLSITRGVGNVGFTKLGEPLGIDITFTVTDLSTVLHAPINPGLSLLRPTDAILAEDNAFNDYLATLSSLSVEYQQYTTRKIALQLTRSYSYFKSRFTRARISQGLFDSTPGRIMSAFAQASARTSGT